MKMSFSVLNTSMTILALTLLLIEIELSETREIFLTNMCYRAITGCQSRCRGICQTKAYMTGDCWKIASQRCRNKYRNSNKLAFVCRCTGDVEVVAWTRDFQLNQDAYKKQQALEQQRLAAQQRAAAEQSRDYSQQTDYGTQQLPDYSQLMDQSQWPDYSPQDFKFPDHGQQMPQQWPPQQLPDKGGRKF